MRVTSQRHTRWSEQRRKARRKMTTTRQKKKRVTSRRDWRQVQTGETFWCWTEIPAVLTQGWMNLESDKRKIIRCMEASIRGRGGEGQPRTQTLGSDDMRNPQRREKRMGHGSTCCDTLVCTTGQQGAKGKCIHTTYTIRISLRFEITAFPTQQSHSV